MPWKKIAKYAGAILIGGVGGSQLPPDTIPGTGTVQISPDIMQLINTIVGAIVMFITMRTKSPKDES